MDTVEALQLMAEHSWGLTRQTLNQAVMEIMSLRLQVIEAHKLVEELTEDLIMGTEIANEVGKLQAAAEQIEKKVEELEDDTPTTYHGSRGNAIGEIMRRGGL